MFEFEDPLFDEFGVSYAFGDVVNGVVVMDTDSGAFSVTWNASGEGFLSPVHLTLHMINPGAGNMVTITGYWNGEGDPRSVTFNSWDDGFEPVIGFSTWLAGQTLYTSGAFEGVNYISGAYSPDMKLVESVQFSGAIEVSPDPLPVPTDDMDGDGIGDLADEWNYSDTSETVYLLGIDTGIPNRLSDGITTKSGHTLADVVQLLEMAAAEDAKNHGQYVQELVRSYKMLEKDGLITQQEHITLIRIIVEHGK